MDLSSTIRPAHRPTGTSWGSPAVSPFYWCLLPTRVHRHLRRWRGAAGSVTTPAPPRQSPVMAGRRGRRASAAKLWAVAGARGLSFNRPPQTVSASAVRSWTLGSLRIMEKGLIFFLIILFQYLGRDIILTTAPSHSSLRGWLHNSGW